MLSKISLTEKDKYCVILLICGILKTQTYEKTEYKGGYQDIGWEG